MNIFHSGNNTIIEAEHYYYIIRHAYLPKHRLLWRVTINHIEGGFLDEIVFRDVDARFIWRHYYHIARHNEWLENGH